MSGLSTNQLEGLRRALATDGFDFVVPLNIDAPFCKSLSLPARVALPCQGLLIANDERLWAPFKRALFAEFAEHPEPLESFVEARVQSAVAQLGFEQQIFFSHQPPFIPIQRIAERARFACISPSQLSVHAEVGPWLSLRALVLLALAPTAALAPAETLGPCNGCPAPCVPPFERARSLGISSADVRRNWRDWVAIRDACPIGREHRYSDEQVEFHYARTRPKG